MLRTFCQSLCTVVAAFAVLALTSCTPEQKDSQPRAAISTDKNANAPNTGTNVATAVDSQMPDTKAVPASDNMADSASEKEERPQADDVTQAKRNQPKPRPKLPEPEGAKRLSPDFDVWIDAKQGVLFVDGEISLREGMLEMFACTRNTKEHESIISVNTRAFMVHAGLLQLGAEPGHPVEFQPEYKPPAGTEIEIKVEWRDENGKQQSVRAQDMIKDIKTEKAMTFPFVFAGSLFWKDPESGREFYMAESGDFICVSNFSTAMLDIPAESSQSNDSLEFVAFTDRIPPLGTPVRMVMKPKLKKDATEEAKAAEKPSAEVSR